MKHERDKQAVLSSMMGYATHKNITVDDFFKHSEKIKNTNDIIKLNQRQAKIIDQLSLSKGTA